MHQDYLDNTITLDFGLKQIKLHALSPLDLVVSKIACFSNSDKEDIDALVRLGLTTAEKIEECAMGCLG